MRFVVAVVIAAALSGCVSSDAQLSANISARTSFLDGADDVSLDCGDQPEFEFSIHRLDGELTLRVLDGQGAVTFEETFRAAGATGDGSGTDIRALFGAPGAWTIQADYEVRELSYDASLRC